MIFNRKKQEKDPIVGVDVGSEWTYLGGLEPGDTKHLIVKASDETGPLFPTRAIDTGEISVVGHHTEELFNAGAPVSDIMAPFEYGREVWEEQFVTPDEDPGESIRRQFFDYLYELVDESVDHWNDRIAVPYRPARSDAGQQLLEEYLADAGFEIEQRVSSPVATTVGYWEANRHIDPHFELDVREGGVLLSVDMGARFVDAAVISVQAHTYRVLSVTEGMNQQSQAVSYAEYKAETAGLDISPTVETAPQRFGLLNRVHRYLPELMMDEREQVTITVPSEFKSDTGTQVTLRAAEAQQFVRAQLESYGEIVQTAIDDAGLESLEDIDLVVTGGATYGWLPLLQWWARQGAAWGVLDDPSSTVDPDATVRITGGIGGKYLPATGASALAHSEVGHTAADIEIIADD